MPRKAKTFESAMLELENITKLLESGELTLEESIQHYKKGMELAVYCNTVLKKAEQEVYTLEQDGFEKMSEDLMDE